MNNNENPYKVVSLDAGGKNILKLEYNGIEMMCPYKSRIPIQAGKISTQLTLAYQECGSLCPHFSLEKNLMHTGIDKPEDHVIVRLTCSGAERHIKVSAPNQKTEFTVIK